MICKWIKKLFKNRKKVVASPIFIPSNEVKWGKIETILLFKINTYRRENNLNELLMDDSHYNIAKIRSLSNAENGVITHNFFYSDVRDALAAIGIKTSAENLGYRYKTANGLFNAWVKSEGHRSAMLGDWKYTGIKVALDKEGNTYYCQIFGK